ncbi:MAG: hypothetical protein JWO95_3578 [Verrucomicrobiales bacterium]|nr:hypothetical protein [Verrucomicrobiales bacterium]
MISKAVLTLGLLIGVMSARAADMQLEAKLVWGSNDEADKVKHTLVSDPKLSSDLHRIFKWSNYYEISTKEVAIAPDKTGVLQMSDRCKLEVKNLGKNWIEVNCIGSGKQVSKGKHSLAPGKWFTLAGNDKNNTAWFVVMKTK